MDYSRQMGLFNPDSFGNRTVSIIGAGATGSQVALQLAMMGIGLNDGKRGVMRVYDFDVVEPHNLANQAFSPCHIGMPKVEALKDVIKKKCGFEIEAYNEKVTNQKSVQANYVFLLTDTMSSRKEIFEKCLKYAISTDLLIETRMGLDQGRVYAFEPFNADHSEKWINTLTTDDRAMTSLCGTSQSVIPTAYVLSSLAVWRMLNHFDVRHGGHLRGANGNNPNLMMGETIFSISPEMFVQTEW